MEAILERIDWIKKISNLFGKNPFTIDELHIKMGGRRDNVIKAISRNLKNGNISKNKNGTYAVNNYKNGTLTENRIRILSEKYGDQNFSIDDISESWGTKRVNVYGVMNVLKGKGIVKRRGKGIYSLTDKGHNLVAEKLKIEHKKEEKIPFKSPSCFISKIENVLGEDGMKDWVYRVAMSNEECIKVLEEEAVKSLAKTLTSK